MRLLTLAALAGLPLLSSPAAANDTSWRLCRYFPIMAANIVHDRDRGWSEQVELAQVKIAISERGSLIHDDFPEKSADMMRMVRDIYAIPEITAEEAVDYAYKQCGWTGVIRAN